jgi:hypothetical protein
LPYHNWRRPLPKPIIIPKVMKLSTLEDVRALVHKNLPAEYREKQTCSMLRRSRQQRRAVNCRRMKSPWRSRWCSQWRVSRASRKPC